MTYKSSDTKNSISTVMAANWCYTDVNVQQFDYLWIIKHFSLRIKGCDQTLKSSLFNSGGVLNKSWRLVMHPTTKHKYIGLQLELISPNHVSVMAIFSISVLNAKGDTVKTFEKKVPHDFGRIRTFDCMDFLRRSEMFDNQGGLLHGDTLSVLCKIDLLDSDVNVCGKSTISSLTATESLLSDDFNRLFETGNFSDVTLVVNETEYPAHKAVLAARSQVFAAMFDHKMIETTTHRVTITDMEPAVLREMLRYMYTNKAPTSEILAKDLLVAADKYGLVQLMRICEFVMCRSISIETAAEMLLLADSHNAKHLKSHAIEYINLNATEVLATEGWENLVKSHCHLIADTYGALILQMKNDVK